VSPIHARLAVKIDGKERVVEIGLGDADDEGGVRVDGKAVDVQLTAAEPGIWILRRGGEQTIAQVDGRGGKLAVEIRRPGRDAVVVAAEVSDARRANVASAARAASAAAPVTVRSPIPGRLIKLLVKPGDAVAAGQTVIVLEAMKMENELAAPRAGRVTEVRCAEGTAVEAGQDLVTVG
jgi:biotin carboxyl carrier protein